MKQIAASDIGAPQSMANVAGAEDERGPVLTRLCLEEGGPPAVARSVFGELGWT